MSKSINKPTHAKWWQEESPDVVYTPSDNTPYADGEEALSNVPPGGTLKIAAEEYDVAREGPLSTDRPVNIVGAGWAVDDTKNIHGTVIRNTGSDAIDSPVIDMGPSNREEGALIANLAIDHEGLSPAIRWDNIIHNYTNRVYVYGNDTAPRAVEYLNESFFSRTHYLRVEDTVDRGIYVQTGPGNDFVFHDCQVAMANANSGARAFESERHGVWVLGGQYDANGTNTIGVQYNQVDSNNEKRGGAYRTLTETSSIGFRVKADGTGRFDNITFRECSANLSNSEGFVVDTSVGTRVINPSFINAGGGNNGVRFTTNALVPTYVMPRAGYNAPVSDGGANNPAILVPWSAPDGVLSNMTLGGVPTFVAYAATQGAPAWYDGSGWTYATGTSFTP